jgi:hypothetical protein
MASAKQASLAYEKRQRSNQKKFRDDLKDWKKDLGKPIKADKKPLDKFDPRSVIGKLAWLCNYFMRDELSAFSELLKQHGTPPDQAADQLEKHAKQLLDETYEHKWKNGLLMRKNALQTPIDDGFISTLWSALSIAINDQVNKMCSAFESAESQSRLNRTCYDCGFLTVDGREAGPANRILLKAKDADLLSFDPQCYRKQWIDYDLGRHKWADPTKELVAELAKTRQDCSFFCEYIPSLSPEQRLKELREALNVKQFPGALQNRPKRGRPESKDTDDRRKILYRIIKDSEELKDQTKRRTLFAALEFDKIIIPSKLIRSTEWLKLLNEPEKVNVFKHALQVLRMDLQRKPSKSLSPPRLTDRPL